MMTEQQVVIIGGSEGIGLAVAKSARTLGESSRRLKNERKLRRLSVGTRATPGSVF